MCKHLVLLVNSSSVPLLQDYLLLTSSTAILQVLPPQGTHLLEPPVSEQPEPCGDGDGHVGVEGKIQEGHPQQWLRCEYPVPLCDGDLCISVKLVGNNIRVEGLSPRSLR